LRRHEPADGFATGGYTEATYLPESLPSAHGAGLVRTGSSRTSITPAWQTRLLLHNLFQRAQFDRYDGGS